MNIKQNLFRQIVTLNYVRILFCFKSKHVEKTRKTTKKFDFFVLLSRIINDPSINSSKKTTKIEIIETRSHSKRLFEIFDKFEIIIDDHVVSSFSKNLFIDVFIQIYEFDTKSLQKVFQISLFIDHNFKIFLSQAINKLERYYCIACDFIDVV